MVYLKKEINGIEMKIEVYSDEFYTICPQCGREFRVDKEVLQDFMNDLDFTGTRVWCNDCEGITSDESKENDITEKMDYKEVLENQIRTLQQAQERIMKTGPLQLVVPIAMTVLKIVNQLDKESF